MGLLLLAAVETQTAENPQSPAPDAVFEFPNTPNGPEARSRAELDAFGRVMESVTAAEVISAAESFASGYPNSQLLPIVRLREMRAEMAANSYAGAVAIGRELLRKNPDNLEALVLMAEILPDFPPSYSSKREAILAEAERDIGSAQRLLQTFHLPQGASAAEFLKNKQRMAVSLEEAAAFVELIAGRYPAAARKYEQALERGDGRSPVSLFRLGLAYYRMGDRQKARAKLEEVMRSNSPLIRQKAAALLRQIDSSRSTSRTSAAKP
jgi:FimV-like protein